MHFTWERWARRSDTIQAATADDIPAMRAPSPSAAATGGAMYVNPAPAAYSHAICASVRLKRFAASIFESSDVQSICRTARYPDPTRSLTSSGEIP